MQQEIQAILDYNKPEYQYIKLAEELSELQEVVIKKYLKRPENQPTMAKIIEEMGDVLLRMKILATQEDIQDAVNTRMGEKIKKLLGYIDEQKYKGGV